MNVAAADSTSISPCALKKRLHTPWFAPAGGSTGFTLIELMLVVALMGILAGLAVPLFSTYRDRAQVAACIAEIKVIEGSVLSFSANENRLPDSLAEVGLDRLKDPWGNPYQYLKIQDAPKGVMGNVRKDHFLVPINSDFDLYSMGKDGQSKPPLTVPVSADDIIRANDGRFVGHASLY